MKILRNYLFPPIIAVIYWLWSHTWRFKIIEHPGFTAARKSGKVIFAHWHGDEMVVLRLGPKYHCAAMTSTSKDGELMTRVLRLFGFGIARGSSTRGGARALIGMLSLMKAGFNATVAVDGPKGPRHKVKAGILALAKHSGAHIVPTGVARSSALVFEKSWNKTYLPWPFAKVIVTFGEPMKLDVSMTESNQCHQIEKNLYFERGRSQAKLLSCIFLSLALISGCSTSPTNSENDSSPGAQSVFGMSLHTPLKPKGHSVTANDPATLKYILQGSIAQKYGFRIGDLILKINGKDISGATEFERRINLLPPSVEIEYKSRGVLNKKYINLNESRPRFGGTTFTQNIAQIKISSPSIVSITKGLITVFASCSQDKEKHDLFVNFIVDSEITHVASKAVATVWQKNPKKLIGSSQETVDALGAKPILVSRKFSLTSVPPGGLLIILALEKQQFAFEFQE